MKQTPISRMWIIAALICLVVSLALAGCDTATHPTETTAPDQTTEAVTETTGATEPTGHEPSIPQETHIPEASIIIDSEPTEPLSYDSEPVSFETALESNDLRTQREWFFDFARTWRVNYMPQFALGEKPPVDTYELLYWCFFVNYDNWPNDDSFGKMSKDYVEETVHTYFDVEFSEHQSHFKSWTYDEETEIYTAWPEGGKPDGLYVLDSLVENPDGSYTVFAYEYRANTGYLNAHEDWNARNILLDTEQSVGIKSMALGYATVALEPIAEVSITFRIQAESGLPLFLAYAETAYNA